MLSGFHPFTSIRDAVAGRGLAALLVLHAVGCARAPESTSPALTLFNGRDLTGWHTWLVDTRREDPRRVFGVTNGLLRISGDGLGYLATDREYSNYVLTVEFRWGAFNTHWGDRLGKARDSGIFLHATGPDGNSHDGGGAFMAALECNVFQGAIGDFLLIRGADVDGSPIAPRLTAEVAPTRDRDGWYTWRQGGQPQTIERWGRLNWAGKSVDWQDTWDFRGPADPENPVGAWNRLECEAIGDRLRFVLNGTVVNEAQEVWPAHGRILLQCEGSEIYFRRVDLRPIHAPPEPAKPAHGGLTPTGATGR